MDYYAIYVFVIKGFVFYNQLQKENKTKERFFP